MGRFVINHLYEFWAGFFGLLVAARRNPLDFEVHVQIARDGFKQDLEKLRGDWSAAYSDVIAGIDSVTAKELERLRLENRSSSPRRHAVSRLATR